MVVETKVNIATAWKTVSQPQVNVGGSWRLVTSIEANVGGSWEEVFSLGPSYSDIITLTGTTGDPNITEDYTPFDEVATAFWRWQSNGRVYNNDVGQFQDGVEWSDLQDSPTAGFYIRATSYSGTPTDGPALNTWWALSSNREWELSANEGDDACIIKVEIAFGDGGAVIDTGYYEMYVEVEEEG